MSQQVIVTTKQISPSASQGRTRNHILVCDRPEAKGGTNQGPMGGEAFLMGLGGCFMSNLLAAIEARKADISDVRAEITATLEEARPRFSAIHVSISAQGEDHALLEKLVTMAERGCIVANSIKPAVALSFSVR